MVQSFYTKSEFHIIVSLPIASGDAQKLSEELSKESESIYIEFTKIYNINIDMINILYENIVLKKKGIILTTRTNRLNRYLKSLGFKARFVSLLTKYALKSSCVEVVLIGGSAGSSGKIIEIVKKVNLSNLALVIVQHVEMDRKGIFDEILQAYTKYKVKYAEDGEEIKKSCIYIAQSAKHLKVKDAYFSLSDEEKYNFSKPSISVSYESFSNYYKEKLLVVQECGYAQDGVDKINLIKKNKSQLIIQDIKECEAESMPMNALKLGVHDYVLGEKNIIRYINFINKSTIDDVWIEYLIYTIFEKYNFDFRLYHRDTIKRRLNVFMIRHEIKNIKDAVGVIIFNPVAYKSFFLQLSINVTELFRNPESFNGIVLALEEKIKNKKHIKVWSAGCSSGEEVYSIAMIFENLGILDKFIIYATDFNDVVLQEAQNGIYPHSSLYDTEKNLSSLDHPFDLGKYFLKNKNYFQINEKIKNKIHFFQHNLATDNSFNEFDIIICKNVIIYFDYNLQKKVFQLFLDSLKLGGFLVLGHSEAITEEFMSDFELCDAANKIYKKVA